ncbi:MAG: hypothetical protein GY884_24395, partial [Proteobacteria bacterium]|nr:hypothetical protein [Pseudomonadota bacterium]
VVASETEPGDALANSGARGRYRALLRVLLHRVARGFRGAGAQSVQLEVQDGMISPTELQELVGPISSNRVCIRATTPVIYKDNRDLSAVHVVADRLAFLGSKYVQVRRDLATVEALVAGALGAPARHAGLSYFAAHGLADDIERREHPGRRWALEQIPWEG